MSRHRIRIISILGMILFACSPVLSTGAGSSPRDSTNTFPGEWDRYPTYDQYTSFMEAMARDFPELCRLDTIGLSVEGREILVMKITDNPGLREPEPAFVYSSTMHGDEVTGFVLLLRLIEHLCLNYESDVQVARLIDNIEIWINPLANPDGTYGEDGELLLSRFNTNGVDLNRNYPGITGSDNPDQNPRQPENLAQMSFLKSIYMVMGANIHDGEEVINYPFDTWPALHADDGWYIRTSREYASMARERSGVLKYMESAQFPEGITNGYAWYRVEGSRQDWINYFIHAREVTIEISYALVKPTPPSDLPLFWYYNQPSLLRYMEHCLFGIHGMVSDSISGEPLKAEIRVVGHDTLNSHIYSDSLTGYFARLIDPGTWELEISMPGYRTVSVSKVQLHAEQSAWLDVQLIPEATRIDTRNKETLRAFVSGNELNLTALTAGPHSVFLYDLNGRLLSRKIITVPHPGQYTHPLEYQQQGIYILRIVSPEGILVMKTFISQWK